MGMMEKILLSPPVTLLIYLLLCVGVSSISKRFAARGTPSGSKENAYACGEDMEQNRGQPEYDEFFQFAFFFTIMHVVALVVATDPGGFSVTSAVYLGVTVLTLFMLLRR